MKTPASMQKLTEEIDKADQEGQLSKFITWQESNKLVYLQACIKEAIRGSICSLLPGIMTDAFLAYRYAPSDWTSPRALRAKRWRLPGRALFPRGNNRGRKPLGFSVRWLIRRLLELQHD